MSTYRLEVRHTTHIDRIPVERLDAAIADWRAKPWWGRIIRRSPLVRAGSMVTTRDEPIEGTFSTADEADAVARATASGRADELRPDSTVVVVRDDGDGSPTVVGGWYSGGVNRI